MRHVPHLYPLLLLVPLQLAHLLPRPFKLLLQLLRAPAQLLNLKVPLDLPLADALFQAVLQKCVKLLSVALVWQQLEQILQGFKVNLQVVVCAVLHRFFLHLPIME